MDRNTITGLVLIGLILIVTTFVFQNKQKPEVNNKVLATEAPAPKTDSLSVDTTSVVKKDTATVHAPAGWSDFVKGEKKEITLENEHLKVRISTKGGRISYAELKDYKTFKKTPLILFDENSSNYGYEFTAGDENINTGDLFFTPENLTPTSVSMVLNMPGGKSIRQDYALSKDSFVVENSLTMTGMDKLIPRKDQFIDIDWECKTLTHERDSNISKTNTTIHYRNVDEKPNYLSETKDAEEKFKKETDWVSFKQQFFCQTLISTQQPFINADLTTEGLTGSEYIKRLHAQLTLPYSHKPVETYAMRFYFGPLRYKTLSAFNLDLERQIPLGWSFFLLQWVNRFIVIPAFNFLHSFISNFGIIILLLTIYIKLLVMPLTYKSYLSMAKMRVIKPELDELKEKYGSDMARMQQEQMKLYRKAGVSPFGGCLPLLLQFPILVAMFRFFPSSIELRQQGFLWATDLSTYDSIYTLPFNIPYYGNHVSLFTLLMTISTLIYTMQNNRLSPQQNEFKWMSYLMPIMFLGFFNNYSAGLSLYYFFFNILTFIQQYLFKVLIDEKKLHAKIEENKRKPQSAKKSGFQARLEELAKKQQALQKQRQQLPGGKKK